MTKFILDCGGNVNGKGKSTLTPVMWAVCNDHIHVVELLIKYGCTLNDVSKKGSTAIDFSLISGNYTMTYYLY